VADLHIPSRTLSVVERRILILSWIKFSTGDYREKRQIFACIWSDCKIADNYLIGYNHVLWKRYESGSFDVLCAAGSPYILKFFFVHVHF